MLATNLEIHKVNLFILQLRASFTINHETGECRCLGWESRSRVLGRYHRFVPGQVRPPRESVSSPPVQVLIETLPTSRPKVIVQRLQTILGR
jgi:hypothetical protein